MIQGNYEKILNIISKSSGMAIDEIERKVEEKRSKLAGLISKEGAAQVIAAEMGMSFDDEKLKINELISGMKKVNFISQVLNISPIRTFMRKGAEGKVCNLFVADNTSNIKIVLWDMHHIELVEKGTIKEGHVIEVSNGTLRDDEVHLGSFSELKLSKEKLENIKTEKIVKEKDIVNFRTADNVSTRAFIVQAFEPRFFEVCPECKRKPSLDAEGALCENHGRIVPEKRALINLVLDDGTETIRCVLFHDILAALGLKNLEDPNKIIEQKQDLMGKEMIFSGSVRNNKMFNTPEFVVENVGIVELDHLIQRLEN